MRLFTRFAAFIAVLVLGLTTATAAQLVAGKDYRLIDPPQPTDGGKKIEVIEFFSYACIHCYNLEPALNGWLKQKPADVEFKRVPAVFRDSWVPLAKAYYALEALGLVDKLHQRLFVAIHDQNVHLEDQKVLFDWVAKEGVDRKKFVDTFNSFSVQNRAQRAVDMTRDYGIEGTPALVVAGKYQPTPSVVNPDRTINYGRYFQGLDQVIDLARKNRSGK